MAMQYQVLSKPSTYLVLAKYTIARPYTILCNNFSSYSSVCLIISATMIKQPAV